MLTQAFPKAQVLATPEVLTHIKKTIIGKIDYWSPILEENAPKAFVLPQPLTIDYLTVGSSRLQIKGKTISDNTYLWHEDSRTILGGIALS